MVVDFLAYAADCTVTGRIEFAGTRISDAIEGSTLLTLRDATLHSLLGTRAIHRTELVLERDELLAVPVDGPVGEPARRVRTVRHRIRADVGPYVVVGELHALPGSAPLRSIRARRRIVPLTSATIMVPTDAGGEARHWPVLLVNAAHIDAAVLIGSDESPWAAPSPATTAAAGPSSEPRLLGLQLALPVQRG